MNDTSRVRSVAHCGHAAVILVLLVVSARVGGARSAEPPAAAPGGPGVDGSPSRGRATLADISAAVGPNLRRAGLPPFGVDSHAMVCGPARAVPYPPAHDLVCGEPPAATVSSTPSSLAAGIDPAKAIDRGALVDAAGAPAWIVAREAAYPDVTRGQPMVFDAARGRIFYVAHDWEMAPSAWEWNGQAWLRLRPSRFVFSEWPEMAYDAARERVVRIGSDVTDDGFERVYGPAHTWEWDGREWTEKTPAVSYTPHQAAALAYDAARGRVVLFGGETWGDWNGYVALSDETWEYDGITWTLVEPATTRPLARSDAAMAYDSARGRVVLFGGWSGRALLRDTWEWDGTDWIDRTSETGPSERLGEALAYDQASGRTVLFGGLDYYGFLGDTWEWDGSNWVDRTTAAHPSARRCPGMAYDASRGRIVLFGGDAGMSWKRPLDDTWEWDGLAWTDVTQPTHPVRAGTPPKTMAFDSDRGRVVSLSATYQILPDDVSHTVEWEHDTWIERATDAAPGASSTPHLAYDEARQRVVLFAGTFVDPVTWEGVDRRETWEWDGDTWEQRAVGAGPPHNSGRTLFYHAGRGRVMVLAFVGGYVVNSPPAQLWEWDGNAWSQVVTPTSIRSLSAMFAAYDRARDRLVTFGGLHCVNNYYQCDPIDETWEWDGVDWQQRTPVVSPPPHRWAKLWYDEARSRIVLFGATEDYLFDTWEWDGTDWIETSAGTSPLGSGPAAFDSVDERAVYFEGFAATTWAYGLLDMCAHASGVTAFSPGLGTDAADATDALGAPDGQTVSLGEAGATVLQVVPPIVDQPGTDFLVYESGARAGDVDERFWVEVSADNATYQFVQDCGGGTCLVDVARAGEGEFGYVRITDVTPQETGTSAPYLGADIDGITAVHCGEACNGLDDNRDGSVPAAELDSDGDGYVVCLPWSGAATILGGGDCDDADASVHPGAVEICNGIDDDCDGVVDNGGGALCDDHNPCTDDSCGGAIGCVHANNTTACNDGNACTQLDTCSGGACVGGSTVICSALDPCHAAGVCDPATGACSNPAQPDGTVCTDNDLCTTGDACRAGICTPTFNGLDEPNPRTNGYYKRLCHGPHSGDELTDADAACIAQITTTFAGISTAAEICGVIEPSRPNNDKCGQTEDDLMVLALNICRARVCTAQGIDSQCGGNTSVGQSLAESDAILASPTRTFDTCNHAKCLDEEINTGQALEMNSLTLGLEAGAVRLTWEPPYLNDGGGAPSKYNVWRRMQRSVSPFAKIGEVNQPAFLDATSGSDAFEYEITAVMR